MVTLTSPAFVRLWTVRCRPQALSIRITTATIARPHSRAVDTAIAKGTSLLVVNLVDSGSDDAAKNIISKAEAAGIPVVFFNRSVSEEAVSGYDKAVFVGTDYEMAGHMQGQMIGEYLVENYDAVDLNGDGVISYVMFKGQEVMQRQSHVPSSA